MLTYKILVTGGAGFIGSFIVDELVKMGHEVSAFDNLSEQVHRNKKPAHLNSSARFIKASVTDYEELKKAVLDSDMVFHEAAKVGVGQSMYQITDYTSDNITGTANLLNILANENHNVKKIIVAASMSSYGEGTYNCKNCGDVAPPLRSEEQLRQKKWELICDICGSQLKHMPTPESKLLQPTSIYAITKATQEEMVLCVGETYGIPAVSLRYFNAYGPRQSLSNPYTGVAAIFMSRVKNNKPPLIFEDGLQTRDFVSVHDIASANILAMKSKAADYEIFNVGSGKPVTIMAVAETITKIYGKDEKIKPDITNKYRKGDVRHCFSDISKIRSKLGFEPKVSFKEGMTELVKWAEGAEAIDMVDKAANELKAKGLVE